MAVEGGIYSYVIPMGRTIAGFFVGVMLGIVGGWTGLTINAMAGYPWGADIHLAIYVIGIGTGAGIGAYVGWINLGLRWYVVAITVVLVIAAGVLGSALANAYDDIMLQIFPFLDTYMSERDERVNVTHFGASLAAILVSTVLGLFYHFRTRS